LVEFTLWATPLLAGAASVRQARLQDKERTGPAAPAARSKIGRSDRSLRLTNARDAPKSAEMPVDDDLRWYADGLRFGCTSCGRCCTGSSGYVWISVPEIRRLASRLGLELDEFGRRFLRRVGERYALVDGSDGACVFLDGKLCRVHEDRPAQCRSFPWWPANLRSREAWTRAARSCEGISDLAPLVVADAIDAALACARSAGLGDGQAADDDAGSTDSGR
jgi:Fe-S-cluster containining protein